MSNLVEIKELGKCYGKKKVMNNLSLSLESGRIVGILGPNGSGKSTLIKMMAGVLKPTSGQITINGYPVGVNTKKIVSYLPERTYLDKSMTINETLKFFKEFYSNFDIDKAKDLLKKLDLDENQKIIKMSKGMQEKVQLVLVMSRKALLYILDEPLGGVDPATRRQFWELIYQAADQGITIFVTTHYMDEAEYCNRISIMVDGQIKALDTPARLKQQFGAETMDDVFQQLARGAVRKAD